MGLEGESMKLPPGFHFSPTDEELILHFLFPKSSLLPFHPNIIPHLDLSLFHPSQLHEKALSSGNELYFFTRLKQKRETESGFWKEIGVTEPIVSANYNSAGNINNNVGFKKYLVFTINGSNQEAHETNWLMQEYHLLSSFHSTTPRPAECERQSKWVLCRVYERKRDFEEEDDGASTELSWVDEVFMSLLDDDVEQISFLN